MNIDRSGANDKIIADRRDFLQFKYFDIKSFFGKCQFSGCPGQGKRCYFQRVFDAPPVKFRLPGTLITLGRENHFVVFSQYESGSDITIIIFNLTVGDGFLKTELICQ